MQDEQRSIPWTGASGRLNFRLRRSGRVRRAQIRIDLTRGLELVVPRRAPANTDWEPFFRENAAWIDEQLAHLAKRRALMPPSELRDGGAFPFLGRSCPLRISIRPGRRASTMSYSAQGLEIRSPRSLSRAETRAAIVEFVRGAARHVLESRVRHWASRLNVEVRGLTIREQETRWGSCSSEGRLSFNWRLMLGPPDVADYVAAHEVAHLLHFDHGPEWEGVLDRILPDWRDWEAWLDHHGDLLVIPEGEEKSAPTRT